MRIQLLAPIAVVVLLPLPAAAVDGVIEINHTKALRGGVTPADAPGYPVTIGASGSYRLTTDLIQPNANTTVIVASADHVTLDLNGFFIRGGTVCSGSGTVVNGLDVAGATTCSGSGTGNGVLATGSAFRISGGGIAGVGGSCVSAASNDTNQVDRVRAEHCGADGIRSGGLISNVTVQLVGGNGIDALHGVRNAHVRRANGDGIRLGAAARATEVQARFCGGAGIRLENAAALSDATVTFNGGNGVEVNALTVTQGATLVDVTAFQNGLAGFAGSPRSAYRGCRLTDNGGGTVTGAPSELGSNFCGTNASCP